MLSEVVDYYAQQRTRQSLATAIVFALAFDPTCAYIASGTTSGMLTVHSLSTAVVTDHMDTEGRTIDSNGNHDDKSHYSSPSSSIVAQHNLARHGSINALCTCGDALFIATDRGGVLCVTWENIINNVQHMHDRTVISRVYPTSTEQQQHHQQQQQQQQHQLHHPCQVNALTACADGESIVAACHDGKLVCIHAGSAAVSAIVSSSSSSGSNKINGMPDHQVNGVDGYIDPYPHAVAASPVDRHCVITVRCSIKSPTHHPSSLESVRLISLLS